MGGFGSGRPTGSGRDKVEACRSIDVNRLHREGCLRAGRMYAARGSRTGCCSPLRRNLPIGSRLQASA
jgi:hypothetical protein